MQYFISYTYTDPGTGVREFSNTFEDLPEYLGRRDILDLQERLEGILIEENTEESVSPWKTRPKVIILGIQVC